MIKSRKIKDLTGMRFGPLLVTTLAFTNVHGAHWSVLCDCGNTATKRGGYLTHTKEPAKFCSRQCRLLLGQRSADAIKVNTKHGLTSHFLFSVWDSMNQRCQNTKRKEYPHYGGRGIKVCERWKTSPANFIEDMEPTWAKGLELDRRDNDGDYEPENCRWVTRRGNAENRRNSVLTAAQIADAELNGIGREVLYYRVKAGWDTSDAISRPKQYHKPYKSTQEQQ